MSKRVDFEFTKNWGSIMKGTKKALNIQLARSLQDVHKVGKIRGPVKTLSEAETFNTAMEAREEEFKTEMDAMKKELADSKKEAVAATKAQKIAENKLNKLAQNRVNK